MTFIDAADNQVATVLPTPARSEPNPTMPVGSIVISESLRGVLNDFSPLLDNIGARRPTSLMISTPLDGGSMTVAFQAQGSTVTLSVRSPTTLFNIPSATITELLAESANVAPRSVLPIANVPLSAVTAIPTDMASSGPKTRRPKGSVTIFAIPKEIPAIPNPASTSTAKRGREAEEPELPEFNY